MSAPFSNQGDVRASSPRTATTRQTGDALPDRARVFRTNPDSSAHLRTPRLLGMPFVRSFRHARRTRLVWAPALLFALLLGTATPASAATVPPGAAANRGIIW